MSAQIISSSQVGSWRIDADATLQVVLESEGCPPLFERTLTGWIAWQTRNDVTVARALRARSVAPQWLAALLALGATVVIEGDEVDLAGADVLRAEALHIALDGLRWGEAHVARTPADEPIVAAVAAVHIVDGVVQEARLALTGVWPEPVRLAGAVAQVVGEPLDEAHIQAVADAVRREVEPPDDFLGSAAYRRAMAGVLAHRVLAQCVGG